MRTLLAALLALVPLLAPLAPAAADASWAVTIDDFEFLPTPIGVETGDAITWTNQDSAFHTATCDPGSCGFDSPTLGNGATFTTPIVGSGTWRYHCDIHPTMTAAIHVGTRDDASPDLAVTQITSARPVLGAAGLGVPHPTLLDVHVTIANDGGSASAATTTSVTLEGGATSTLSVSVPALAPGASATVTARFTQPWSLGSGTATVALDPANAVVERTESDNGASASVPLGPV